MQKQGSEFTDRLVASPGGEHLRRCHNCGTCVSRCMVQERQDPAFNPRRLIKKASLGFEQEAYADRTAWLCTACDICFAGCPQQVHISEVLWAIRRLAIDSGHDSIIRPAVVNSLTCVACGLCADACPYDAIVLRETKVLSLPRVIAHVDPNACMACGLCGALCRSASIGLGDGDHNENVMQNLKQWLEYR